jgi:hypothetical protein
MMAQTWRSGSSPAGIWIILIYIAVILTIAFVATALQPGGPF